MMNPFVEKIGVLAVTAGLSGLLIPVVTENMAHKQFLEQRLFETELARENAIIEAQVKLIETLSDLLWEYQLLAIGVSYYQSFEDKGNYAAAVTAYNKKAGDLLGKIRSEISKSLRLTSLETYNLLIAMYYDDLVEMDVNLQLLVEGHGDQEDWFKMNQYAVYELSQKVDNIIYNLGVELELSYWIEADETE